MPEPLLHGHSSHDGGRPDLLDAANAQMRADTHFKCGTCGQTRAVPRGWGTPICAGFTYGHGSMEHVEA